MKHKNGYKIGEISKAYDIGIDSLRYYEEIGILHPHRDHNNYRMYDVEDIRRLNILKELRSLGFSFDDIKKHLQFFDLQDTLSLFNNELMIIEQKIGELYSLKSILKQRVKKIEETSDLNLSFVPHTKEYDDRYVIQFNEGLYADEEVDFTLKTIQNTDNDLYMIGHLETGAQRSLELIKKREYGNYRSVFFTGNKNDYNKVIQKGSYLSLYVIGDYSNVPEAWQTLLTFAKQHHYQVHDEMYEFYIVDNHTTSNFDEYVTELNIRVTK